MLHVWMYVCYLNADNCNCVEARRGESWDPRAWLPQHSPTKEPLPNISPGSEHLQSAGWALASFITILHVVIIDLGPFSLVTSSPLLSFHYFSSLFFICCSCHCLVFRFKFFPAVSLTFLKLHSYILESLCTVKYFFRNLCCLGNCFKLVLFSLAC